MEKVKCMCPHFMDGASRLVRGVEPDIEDRTCPHIAYPVPVGCPFMLELLQSETKEGE
jgi:hypothetical protein